MPIYTIKLLDRQTIATNTLALTFEKPEGFTFTAGQYGGFTLINPAETDAKGATRRFSYFSAPEDEQLMIITRIQSSAYKRNLQTLPLQHPIKMAGPTGNFVLHEDSNTPAVMIAGGMGLAPFHSIIKDSLRHRKNQHITLFYGNQTLADSACLNELLEMEKAHPQFKCIPVLANPHTSWRGQSGFIDDEVLVKHLANLDLPIYYVCGSPTMVNAMQIVLRDLQIPEDRIKVEDFPGY